MPASRASEPENAPEAGDTSSTDESSVDTGEPRAAWGQLDTPDDDQPLRSRKGLWWWAKAVFWSLFGLSLAGGLAGVGLVVWLFAHYAPQIPPAPELMEYRPPVTTRIYGGDGQLIGEFFRGRERRDVVSYDKIPPLMVAAFVVSEDAEFFDHHGINPLGIVRAMYANLKAGGIVQGGSTITQQTSKALLYPDEIPDRTYIRKVKEAILAWRLEQELSKEEILTIYLNQIFLGHGAYGVQAAARNYYGKNVWELNLAEISYLAGLPQAPSRYSPYGRPERADHRRRYVLRRLVEEGFITAEQEQQALETEVAFLALDNPYYNRTPYFTEQVRRELSELFGENVVMGDGLQVETTVSPFKQHLAREMLFGGILEAAKRQGFRGPVLEIPEARRQAFLEAYDVVLHQGLEAGDDPLREDSLYFALVTGFNDEQRTAAVKVGRYEGVIPIATAMWAREPNSNVFYLASIRDKFDGWLREGDVVVVRPTTARKASWGNAGIEVPRYLQKLIPGLEDDEDEDADEPPPRLFALETMPDLQGAMISVDPHSGYVEAMIGGNDFDVSQFNRAVQACRQPGSAFKPTYYAAAIQELGLTPATMIFDAPVVFDDSETDRRWTPENYGEEFHGEVLLRTALINSMNVPSVKVMDMVGVEKAVEYAHGLGITTELNENLSLALGASCVTLWELMHVYVALNRLTDPRKLTTLRLVTDRDQRILLDYRYYNDPRMGWDDRLDRAFVELHREPDPLMEPTRAYVLLNLLTEVASVGTAARARALGMPVAGKTGTTNDSFDTWFMGFTHDLVTGVWVGYDTYDIPLARNETGGHTALPVWLNYMKHVLDDRPQAPFEVPEGIVRVRIDSATGKLARPSTDKAVFEVFEKGTAPEEYTGQVEEAGGDDFFQLDTGMDF